VAWGCGVDERVSVGPLAGLPRPACLLACPAAASPGGRGLPLPPCLLKPTLPATPHRPPTQPLTTTPPHPPLRPRRRKGKSFSRRRAFRADKDVDYINDRNAHFNKKIQRAFGAATAEIKANLERGTALPDH
jgi:hypothetical protein